MTPKFWDTSALLSLLLEQSATEQLKAIAAADDSLALWWGARIEAASAVWRLFRGGEIGEPIVSQVMARITEVTSAGYEVQPTEQVRNAALRALRIHELRSADALQLGAALVYTAHDPVGVGFVCLDRRLRDAAMREGFDVLPR